MNATGLFAALLLVSAQANSKNSCEPGSDAACSRFGENMCCAHVDYTFRGDRQTFYSCASLPGIEYSGGIIYDQFGF
jgi:hypothetical protein